MRRALACLAFVIALVPACKSTQDNTKIVVAVWSDLTISTELDSIQIDVTGPTGNSSDTFALTAGGEAGKTKPSAVLELVPMGAKNATFTVTATGLHGQTAIVSQTARVSFVAGQSLLLTLFLGRDCQGMVCPVDYTCAAGACTQPVVMTNLPPYVPNKPFATVDGSAAIHDVGGAFDSGGAMDNGASEAGSTGLLAVDGAPCDTEEDQPQDIHPSTGGTGGTGGIPGSGGVGGTGGVSGIDAQAMDSGSLDAKLSDTRPIDVFAADALDAPLSGSGGAGGSGGTSGGSGGTVGTGGTIGSGGTVGTGGATGMGGTTAACADNSTKCSGNTLQTCTNGQWNAGTACGPLQTCFGPDGTAKCTCNPDPVCSSIASTCVSQSTLAACARDSYGCFYESATTPCPNGLCSGGACCPNAVGTTCLSGTSAQVCTAAANACPTCTTLSCSVCSGTGGSASCCTNECTDRTTKCLSSTSLGTCATGSNGCTAFSNETATCSAGQVCERCGTATCADPNWNEWPLPNSQVDVTAGAPNLESYTDNGDGTVTDNVTGLMWQKSVLVTDPTYTWAEAATHCSTLSLGGHTDWRLPTEMELMSIVDSGQLNPSINGTYFPSTPSAYFWSSSPAADSPSRAWLVYFNYGSTLNTDVSYTFNARCVR